MSVDRAVVAVLVSLLLGAMAPPCLAAVPPSASPADPLDAPGLLAPSGVTPPPPVTATTWLVADLGTGDVLAAQGAHVPLAPASTLKLLTALAVVPLLSPQQTWTATDADASADGSKVGLVPGSVYTSEDLLHGLLVGSGNDASNAVAVAGGGVEVVTQRMQSLADTLGARDTVVRNPSGLDAEGQVTSAADLALFGRAALADPWIARLVTTERYPFPGGGTTFGPERPRFEIANGNDLLGDYPGALGLKTGYTVAARGSFVGAVERDGRRYLVALLAAEGRTPALGQALLDWAIVNGPAVTQPVGSLDPPDEPAASSEPTGTPPEREPAAAGPTSTRAPEAAAAPWGVPTPLAVVLLVLAVVLIAALALAALSSRRPKQDRL